MRETIVALEFLSADFISNLQKSENLQQALYWFLFCFYSKLAFKFYTSPNEEIEALRV